MNKIMETAKKVYAKLHHFFTVIINPDIRHRLRQVAHRVGYVLHFALRIFLIFLLTGVLTLATVGVFGALYITYYLDVDTNIRLENIDLAQTSHIYAEDPDKPGEYILLDTVSGGKDSVWTPYGELNRYLIDAAVSIEDKRFFRHDGVDWKRTAGAFVYMFMGSGEGGQFGGSSITQQLIKNLTGNKEATIGRKLNEVFQALEFEKQYSKETIMGAYLNWIYLGRGCNGVQTAAQKYFGKNQDELTLAESACLISITNNPSLYDPISNPENNKERRTNILHEMYDQQYITKAQYDAAKLEVLDFITGEAEGSNVDHVRSWYVDQVLSDLKRDLVDTYGWTEAYAWTYIATGGLDIYTCMDVNIQKAMDDIWNNPDCWPKSPDEEPPQAAMMIIDHDTGAIKALNGGLDKTGNTDFNRATQAYRQPGSSIKPLTVYSQAFEQGLITPYTPVDDMPVSLVDNRGYPRNSPAGYSGRINVITALTKSKNTVAVRLLQQVGIFNSYDFAYNTLHLQSLIAENGADLGTSPLALGGLTRGLSVRDITTAYSSFPNGGFYMKSRTYSRVVNQDGQVVFNNDIQREKIFKDSTVNYITQCLTSATTSAGTGSRARLTSSKTIVAGKTGTTTADFDRWFAGYTPYYTAVCWFGYDIPRSLEYSANPAIHLWQQVMDEVHKGLPEITEFEMPGTMTKVTLCRDSGLLPTEACKADPREQTRLTTAILDVDHVPRNYCDVHYYIDIDTASGHLATPYCPQETRKRVGLMYLPNRFVPLPMSLTDENYTLRFWAGDTSSLNSPVAAQEVPEGYYRVSAEASAYNTWCELHMAPPVATPEPEPSPTEPDIDETEPPEEETPPDGGDPEGAANVMG